MPKITETHWAITGRWGKMRKPFLYMGLHFTRKEAIKKHCFAYIPEQNGPIPQKLITSTWKRRRRSHGDRVVKVRVTVIS